MSTAQRVQKVIDELSDGITSFVYLVVVLQENNANPPPNLLDEAGNVSKTSSNLSKIAKELANTNYKQFTAIQEEIHDAADSVDQSIELMTHAIKELSNVADKKKAWDELVSACRVIAGRTIRLLQIVYGAELKRIYAIAEDVETDLNKLNIGNAASNTKAFADHVSNLATQARKCGKLLSDRAKGEEIPAVKTHQLEVASKLIDGAKDIIDAANSYIKSPGNDSLKKTLEAKVEDLKEPLAYVRGIARQSEEQAMRDARDGIAESLAKIRTAAERGDKNELQKLFGELQNHGDNFQRVYRRRRGPNDSRFGSVDQQTSFNRLKNRIRFVPKNDGEDPMSELKALWAKFAANRDDFLVNPKDTSSTNVFFDWGVRLRRVADKAIKEQEAIRLIPFCEAEEKLDQFTNHLKKEEYDKVFDVTKEILGKINKVTAEINNEKDPERNIALRQALKPLNALLPDLVSQAKEAVKKDTVATSKSLDTADKMRYILAKAKYIIAPHWHTKLEEKLKKAKTEIADVRTANKGTEFSKSRAAFDILSNSVSELVQDLRSASTEIKDNAKASILVKSAEHLDEKIIQPLVAHPPKDATTIEKETNAIDTSLEEVWKQLNQVAFEDLKDESELEKGFESAIAEVARTVKRTVYSTSSSESKSLSDELAKLAAAAKAGKRQEMISHAKRIGELINEFVANLRTLADKVAHKDPYHQDKFLRLATAIANYSTQLKIMVSVRASSQDTNADESLVFVTRNLGRSLTEAITSTAIVKSTILKDN
eukprot:TRINITY_DN10407_c0_g1_i1.p1 TRINITY_DN10407_c0_g1~~TRINITY_DN10407_c0_g1_i1.p1  ORF type:complete len:770 (-),score=180.74 TRINITY_DN10407_c0_g1_i1:26-2335(-)